jgi:RNA polymerase-interacting CarD/CdnL/TRCF family regulator
MPFTKSWTAPAARPPAQLSRGERELYLKSRQLLSREIGLARGLEPAEADAWIDEQLTPIAS